MCGQYTHTSIRGICFGSDLPVSGSWSGSAGDGCRLREREAGGGRRNGCIYMEKRYAQSKPNKCRTAVSGMYMPHLPGFREKELSQYFLLTFCLNGFLLAIDSTLH